MSSKRFRALFVATPLRPRVGPTAIDLWYLGSETTLHEY